VDNAIYIALGGNLPHPRYGPPKATLQAALAASEQPWYFNAVAEITTALSADRLLAELHAVEEEFGRVRGAPNAPRLIDLDLLDYRGEIAAGGPGKATLPHPRMIGRAFVLRPLADLAPNWRHPVNGTSIQDLVAALPGDQVIRRT
jgi:2-amino-4-hydroxy-6-hydroxymethyldihydropteridine diphosphokinase